MHMSVFAYFMYGLLFFALILEPHLLQGHIMGAVSSAYLQSFVTALILALAGGVHVLHRQDIKKREQARLQTLQELKKSSEQLNDSLKYIALANRRLPLLKEVTTDLLAEPKQSKRDKQKIFQELLATAVVSLSRAEWGVFRFVEMRTGRTVKEFIFAPKPGRQKIFVGNRALLSLHDSSGQVVNLNGYSVITTTHRGAPVQCHYIFPRVDHVLSDSLGILQNIIDQTQILYKYVYQ